MTVGRFLAGQIGASVLGLVALALVPPARGRMVLVPLWPGGAVRLAAAAVERGARLVATGPVAGSLVVEGERARLAPLLARGVVPLSATALDCGGTNSG